ENGKEGVHLVLYDDKHPRGRVGLRTWHSAYKFRNIRVTAPDGKLLWDGPPAVDSTKTVESPKPSDGGKEGWVPLFNGKDLTDWKVFPNGTGNWRVEDGRLIGSGPSSHLFTERGDYKNFHFRVEARISDGGNSGQFFRTA